MTKRNAQPSVKEKVMQAKASFAVALDAAYPAKAASPSRPAASDEHRLMSAMAKAIIYKSLTLAPVAFKILPMPFEVVHDSILKVQNRTKFAKDNLNDILLRSPFSLGFYTLTRNDIKLIHINLEFVCPTAPARVREMLAYVPWPLVQAQSPQTESLVGSGTLQHLSTASQPQKRHPMTPCSALQTAFPCLPHLIQLASNANQTNITTSGSLRSTWTILLLANVIQPGTQSLTSAKLQASCCVAG